MSNITRVFGETNHAQIDELLKLATRMEAFIDGGAESQGYYENDTRADSRLLALVQKFQEDVHELKTRT